MATVILMEVSLRNESIVIDESISELILLMFHVKLFSPEFWVRFPSKIVNYDVKRKITCSILISSIK